MPQSRGEVGKVGVAIDTIDDMEIAIPLDRVTVHDDQRPLILLASRVTARRRYSVR